MGAIPERYTPKALTFAQLKGPITTYFVSTFAVIGSTSSGIFVDYPGPIDKIIKKRETATALFISGFAGAFKTVAIGTTDIGILINGVDYFLGRFFFNTLSEHNIIPFNTFVAPGVAAGDYNIRLRWKSSVTGNTDDNDPVQLRIEEGYFA